MIQCLKRCYFEGCFDFFEKNQIIKIEIYTEKKHKHTRYHLSVAWERRKRIVFDTKSTRSGSAKSRTHRVKPRHIKKKEQLEVGPIQILIMQETIIFVQEVLQLD